jgi:D-glycero-D-manno-heptose 1,7-bisphosphate phosphatase
MVQTLAGKAVFLDRDGVLNMELGEYVSSPELLKVPQHVIRNCHRLQEAGYSLIVITNQGGIAKGLYSHETLNEIHEKMSGILQQGGVTLTAIYYCPHHTDFGKCLCRKPERIMIERA